MLSLLNTFLPKLPIIDFTKISKFEQMALIIIHNNKKTLESYISDNKIENINTYHDIYGNNLLHISTSIKKQDIILFLLNNNVSMNKKNIFDESPWTQIVKTHNENLISIFTKHNMKELENVYKDNHSVKIENNRIKRTIKELQNLHNSIKVKYDDSVIRNNRLNNEVSFLKKRFRDDSLVKNDDDLVKKRRITT